MPTTTPIVCDCGKRIGAVTTPDARPDTTNTIDFSPAPVQPGPFLPIVICMQCQDARRRAKKES